MGGVATTTRLGMMLTIASAAGCGWVVDADRFRLAGQGDGSADIFPKEVYEGAGGRPSAGLGVPVLVRGAFGPTVGIEADDSRVTLDAPVVATDGSAVATRVWIDPFLDLFEGETTSVVITVVEGNVRRSFNLIIKGLDELSLAADVSTDDLRPLYSSIYTSTETILTGTAAARLVSVGFVDIGFGVSASATGRQPGPGGVAGGPAGRDGLGSRGGRAGDDAVRGCAGGGAGAGASADGEAGGGGSRGGTMGLSAPTRVLGLGGHGGGGGGRSGESPGSDGGGGGGVLWLEGADVRIDAAVLAEGASGQDARARGCGGESPGAGGGGAGGVVMVRAGTALDGAGRLVAAGGEGGAGNAGTRGGAGSPGWIRIDAASISDDLTAEQDVWRGPAWTLSNVIVKPAEVLSFVAPSSAETSPQISIDGTFENTRPVMDDNGRGTWMAPAQLGLYALCVVIAEDIEEGESCVTIAVLP